MSDPFDHEIDPNRHEMLKPRRSLTSSVFGLLVGLAIIAAAAGYLFLNRDRLIEAASATRTVAPSVDKNEKEMVSREEFQSFEQHLDVSLKSIRQDTAAQQSNLKSLLEQVAALSASIDELKNAAKAIPSPVSESPAVTAPHKKPTAKKRSRSAGAISVGGAPLPISRH